MAQLGGGRCGHALANLSTVRRMFGSTGGTSPLSPAITPPNTPRKKHKISSIQLVPSPRCPLTHLPKILYKKPSMTSKSNPSMEGEELAAAAAVHGHAQQQHETKVMRTDKFPFRVPTGPTFGPEQSSSTSSRLSGAATGLYLYGGAPAPPATAATTATSITTSTAAAAALQPFPAPPPPIPATFKSPGMAAATAAAATFRFPFTAAQWQELERQAMIYKYMMATVPIPSDLLLPSKFCYHDSSSTPLGRGSTFNLRFSNSVDPEPGRCRRTDGKKWRCSRDVAPDQKYCERHMHRGRPRSRKLVEVQARAAQALPSTTTATTTTTSSNPQLQKGFPATQSSFLAAKSPFFTHVEQQPRLG